MRAISIIGCSLLAMSLSAQIRVNVGGPQYTDINNNVWSADYGCTSASTYTYQGTIQGTNAQPLYQTGRTDPSSLSCSYVVPTNTYYLVTLKFAEYQQQYANSGNPGNQRLLNIFINGVKYYTAFNVYQSCGFATACDISPNPIPVNTGGTLSIVVTQQQGQPMLSAIEINPAGSAAPISANQVTYDLNVPGAQLTTAAAKLNSFYDVVADFGADPSGTNVSTTAFANAISSLPANGGTIMVPPGTYKGAFVFPMYPKAIRVLCAGENSTILQAPAANTPLFFLSATVPNFSSPKIEIGNCSLQANAAGSTGAAIVLDGMAHPYIHDLTYLSNGSGNFSYMFSQNTTIDGRSFGADIERVTVDQQSGLTTFAKTIQYGSINLWKNIWITSNTGMTTVFDFTATGTGGNIIDSWICEGNLSAVCLYPGNNLHERNGYYENNAGYITGNGGGNDTFTEDTYSGNSPGTGVTGTYQESGWTFINDVWPNYGIPPTAASMGLYNARICQGNICTDGTGGILTSTVGPPNPYVTVVTAGGSLSSTSCNGAGVCTYVMTSVDQVGNESTGQTLAPITVTGTGKIIQGQTAARNGAAHYNVYGPNCPTTCGFIRMATMCGEECGFIIDDGTISPGAAVPPTQDRTGSINAVNGIYSLNGFSAATDIGSTTNTLAATLRSVGGIGDYPWAAGFTVLLTSTAHAITAGSYVTFNLNGVGALQVNGMTLGAGYGFPCSIAAGSPLELIWNGSTAWLAPGCMPSPFQDYIPDGAETGANNAIATGTGYAPLVPGLVVTIQLQHSLQAGANTLAWNAGSAVAIKKHTDPTANISTAYTASGVFYGEYTGAVWVDLSQ